MKGKWKKALGAGLLALAFSGALGMAACGEEGGGSPSNVVTIEDVQTAYDTYCDYMAEQQQEPLDYAQWFASLQGEMEGASATLTITFENGYFYINGVGITAIELTYSEKADGQTVIVYTFRLTDGTTSVQELPVATDPDQGGDTPTDPDQGGEDDDSTTYIVAEGTPMGGYTVTLNDDGTITAEQDSFVVTTWTYEWKDDALGINDGYSTYYFAVEENALVAYVPDMDYETYSLAMMDAFVYIYNDNSTQSGEYYVRSYREMEEDDGSTSVYTSTFSSYVDFEKFELIIEGQTFSFADGETLRPFMDVAVGAGSILGENVRLYQASENGGVIVADGNEYEWSVDYETQLVVVSYPMNDVTQEILFTLDWENKRLDVYMPAFGGSEYTNAEMDYSLCVYNDYCVVMDANQTAFYSCVRVEEDGVLLIGGMRVKLDGINGTYSFVTDGGEDKPIDPDDPVTPDLPDGVEYAFVGEVAFQVDMRVNKIELYDDNTAKMYYINEADEYVEWTNLNETIVWMLDGNALYLGLGNEPCALFGVDTENGTLSEYDFASETVENVYTYDDGGMYVHTITTYGNGFLKITLGSFNYTLPYETDGKTLTLLPTSYGMSWTINDDNTLTWNEEDGDGGTDGPDDPSEVTVVGVYTYTNAAGESYEITLYSNNTVEQNGSVLPCTVEGNILRIMMGDSPMYFELGETEDGEKVMTDYVPELPILNTYTYQDYGMRFTVYGVYTGAGAYIAIYSIPTTTGTQQATTEVTLDLDAGTLKHSVGTFTINSDNTLTLVGDGDDEEDVTPENPTVELAYTLTGSVYLLIEQEVVKMELWEDGNAFIYGVDENGSLTQLYAGIVTWEMVNDLTSKSTDLKLYLKGEPCAIYNVDLEKGTFSEYVFDEKMKDATYTYTETEESQDGTSTYTQTFTTYLNGFALWSDDDGDSAVVAYMVSGNVFRLLPSGFGPTFIIGENNELTVDESEQACERCGRPEIYTQMSDGTFVCVYCYKELVGGGETEEYCYVCETNVAVIDGLCERCYDKIYGGGEEKYCSYCGANYQESMFNGICDACYEDLVGQYETLYVYSTVDCAFNGTLTLNDGGYAFYEETDSDYNVIFPYSLEGTLLTIHAEDAPIYLTVVEAENSVTNYMPTEAFIGTYVYTESTTGITATFTYTVYGNSTEKGVYKCVMNVCVVAYGEVIEQRSMTSEVEFDLQGAYLYHAGYQHGYQINDDNTLTLVDGEPMFGDGGSETMEYCENCGQNEAVVSGLCEECYETLLTNLGNVTAAYATVDCAFNGKITLYDSGNVLVEDTDYIEVMQYTLNGTLLTLMQDGAPIYLTVNESEKYVTNYIPTEALIGTYVYTESFSDISATITYVVYGNSTEKGVYKCVMSVLTVGGYGGLKENVTCTTEVEFDLQGAYLYHAGMDHGYEINEDDTLTLVYGDPMFNIGTMEPIQVCGNCGQNPAVVNGLCEECYQAMGGGSEMVKICRKCGTNSAVTGGYCDTCLGKVEATYKVEEPFCYMFGETATLYESNICLLYSEGDYLDLTYEIQNDLVVLNVPDAFGDTFGMYFTVEDGTLVHYVPNATPSTEYVDETTGMSFKTYENSSFFVICMNGMEMYTAEARVMMDSRIYVAGSYVELYDDGTCKLYCPMCNTNFVTDAEYFLCDECAAKINNGTNSENTDNETIISGNDSVIADSTVQLG